MALVEIDRHPRVGRGADSALRNWVRALEATASIAGRPHRILLDAIEDAAAQRADAEALIAEHATLTYRALIERSRRYARWALDQKLGTGESVCLMMPNRPDYLAIWLGITSVGGVVSLLNTQLRGPALAHCVDIVAPKHAIVAGDLLAQYNSAEPNCEPTLWSHGCAESDSLPRIDTEIERFSAAPLQADERRGVTIADRALTIYTSGTTGLPKAANVSHRRLMQWSLWFGALMNAAPDDRMYDCLPLYHSVGGVVAVGALLTRGGSVVIREKFSAREFWDDVTRWNCTLFQYIGELCRYLVNAPPHPRERTHRLRLACGNGLRADVWRKFQSRFDIPRILEFYAATEGNVSLYNVEGKVGAVGRVPPFLTHRFPLALVKFDAVSGQPERDAARRCIRCAVNETGEAIGKIADDAAAGAFEGYTSAAETERKILRDVFAPGDAWFRTGDLMRMDVGGFYYFVDRIGDTFRWKGENVSATEVAAVLTEFPGISAATVYGVAVPGADGKAGMAAIAADSALDLAGLRAHLARRLPDYARPLFLRLVDRIDTTASFKHTNIALARDGFDLAVVRDPIYVDDPQRNNFVPLDAALAARMEMSKVRF
ncbi:MAG TPA: long-chain-acyl-CoA synthetase [Xanthobacteraceae bacterium]|jgi:fatty-acyl-CoA synthase|nr:long-chain-acyl-CoA synthetase [Xanthobacteraceae bacterium]